MTLESATVVQLPLGQIVPGDNDRTEFDPNSLTELAQSIKEHGLAQPITVRPISDNLYQIVAGERRWRAHKIYTAKVEAGEWRESARCKPGFVSALVRDLDDEQADAIMLAENDQREDLNPLDRAKAYKSRMEKYGWDVKQLAATVKKSERTVEGYLSLLALIPEAQQAALNGDLPLGHGQLMAPLDADRQRLAMQLIQKGDRVTYDMFREYVSKLLEQQSQASMFDLTDMWVAQVNTAEALRQNMAYNLPTRDDLPEVVIEKGDNASAVIRRYIQHLKQEGHIAEAGAIGYLSTGTDWVGRVHYLEGCHERRCIVESYPLTDSPDYRYSIGVHTVTVRFLDNGERRRISGFYFAEANSPAEVKNYWKEHRREYHHV